MLSQAKTYSVTPWGYGVPPVRAPCKSLEGEAPLSVQYGTPREMSPCKLTTHNSTQWAILRSGVIHSKSVINHNTTQVGECNEIGASDVVPVLCEGLLYEKDPEITVTLLNALACLVLPGSAVSFACEDRARKCFLFSTLRAIITSNPTAVSVLEKLKTQLHEDEAQ